MQTANNYDKVLLDIIPNLSSYKFSCGREGTAYFVDDHFVVKTIDKHFDKDLNGVDSELFDIVFDRFCTENAKFYNQGCDIPYFYSWIKRDMSNEIAPGVMRYYILEDRIKGREFYYEGKTTVPRILDFMEEKYKHKIKDAPPMDIIEGYLQDYIEINKKLQNISNDSLIDFFDTIYYIFKDGEYIIPDVHARNVLITPHNKLVLVDNYMKTKPKSPRFVSMDPYYFVVTRTMGIFRNNRFIQGIDLDSLDPHEFDIDKIKKLIQINSIECSKALKRVLDTLKKYSGAHFCGDKYYRYLLPNEPLNIV